MTYQVSLTTPFEFTVSVNDIAKTGLLYVELVYTNRNLGDSVVECGTVRMCGI
jgi:hypothetical protein